MMERERPALEQHSIVLVGKFNPTIFQPAWFASEALIREQEKDAAQIEIIHPDVTEFQLDWLRLQVTRERFLVESRQDGYYPRLRDLVSGTFLLLRHTQVTMLGINIEAHYRARSDEEWHAMGNKLAPKDTWQELLKKPGTQSLTIQGERPDQYKGYIRATVEPSVQFSPGFYLRVNDHFQTDDPERTIGCAEILGVLGDAWDGSVQRSHHIISGILNAI